jgi:hypothetical protein
LTTIRANIAFAFDSGLPRDVMTITPHYETDDPQALINVLRNNIVAGAQGGATNVFNIKAYDAKKAPPNYPLAETSHGTGYLDSHFPRELALCLSYSADFNRPSLRGRLYIPMALIGGGTALRPTPEQQALVTNWADMLTGSLPTGSFWVVYSKTHQTSAQVTNAWCDDEWDIVRSRGLRGSSRHEVTVP